MGSSLLFVGILCVALVSANTFAAGNIPVFFWSGKGYFSGKNVEVLETVTSTDVETSFDSIIHTDTQFNGINSLNSYLTNVNSKPEIIVLFIGSKLRTDEITRFGSVYAANSNGGIFSHLKKALDGAETSLVAPYAYTDEAFAEPLIEHLIDLGSTTLVASEINNNFVNNLKARPNVRLTSVELLEDSLISSDILSNGVTDVLVVFLDTEDVPTSLTEADDVIGRVMDTITKPTAGNYVSLFTGNTPGASLQVLHDKLRPMIRDSSNSTHDYDSTFWDYWPHQIWEAIIVMAVMIIILAIGLVCLCDIQTPDRFEGGVRGRQ